MVTSDKTEIVEPVRLKKNKFNFKGTLIQIASLPLKFTGVKTLLLLITILLLFFRAFIPGLSSIDHELFQVSKGLKKEKAVKSTAVIVTIAPSDFDTLLRAPDRFPEFRDFIKKMSLRKKATLAFLTDEIPFKYEKVLQKNTTSFQKELYSLFQKKNLNIALRQNNINGFHNYIIENYIFNYRLKTRIALKSTHFDKLPEFALTTSSPRVNRYNTSQASKTTISPISSQVYISGWPLIWKAGNASIPDILSVMISQVAGVTPEWENGNGLFVGFEMIKTDPFGYVKPEYSPRISDSIKKYSLRDVLRSGNFRAFQNKAVFIGEEKDPMLVQMAEAYAAITSGSVSNTPWQAVWIEKILICVFFLFLILIVPRLKTVTSVIISFIIVAILLIILFGNHVINDQWLLVTYPITFLIFGLCVVLISHKNKERFIGLQQKANLAFFNLGRFQFEQNRFDQAFESLIECKPENHVLELLYKLGVSLERKRQYDKACTVFEYITLKSPRYNDAKERAERLTNIIFGRTSVNLQTGSGTLEISVGGANKPVLGRYEIEKELGRGAMGIVYLGEDPKIGRKIAIKTMDFTQTFEGRFEEVKERFFREAKAAGRLAHPNIVTIYDAGEEQDLAYIAMDYVPGVTLSNYTKKNLLLPVKDVYDIICQVAEALNYAHRKEIVHRDIKPGNIIYNKELSSITVTDFGIARIADTTMTRPGVILGSPSFMSPEQLRGKEIDGRADIFSLGVTMFQLLTGTLPFTGTDLSSLGYQITSVKHSSVRSINPNLPKSADRIINKALQKNPMKRYQTAEGMARVLRSEIASL